MSEGEMSESEDALLERARARLGQTLCRKYRIERILGVGGMAVVYVATHRNGREVAIKMLHPELSLRADLRKRFLQEGHAANAVKHSGAVAVLDDDVAEDGAAFLVMELLEGQSIEELWRANGGILATKTVLAIARELCDALAAAHAVGIVHRDIKPANLFLTSEGRVKVLDFGLARVRDGTLGANATATGLVFGTPAFLPPEQAAGRISQIDARTDLWAVGATMFTLLTGRTVHEGESSQHLVMLSATKPAPSLAALLPDAEPELVQIVDRALAFERNERWASAREMHGAICAASDAIVGEPGVSLSAMSDVVQIVATNPILPSERAPKAVGSTSAPVASSAPPRGQEQPGRSARTVVARIRTAIASIPMSSVAWRKRASLAVAAGMAAAAVIVIVLGRMIASPEVVEDARPASSPPPAVTLDSTASSPQVAQPDSATSAPVGAGTTVVPKSVSPKAPPHRSLRPAAPSSRPKEREPDCAQDYVIDAAGKKVWKPECVH